MDQFSLKGKNAVITGASRGLGLAMTKALAGAGANVAIISTSSTPEVKKTCAEIKNEFGVIAKSYAADIADADAIRTLMGKINSEFDSIDIFVANAGIAQEDPAETFDLDDWKRIFDVNVHGTFYCVQAVSKYMLEKGKGSSILISSISALVSNKPQFQCCYNASKGAVTSMCKCLAYEWATRGIRVNCINPGYMKTYMLRDLEGTGLMDTWTDLIPMNRLGKPEDLGGAIIYFGSDASQYVTGLQLYVDGGYTIV